MASLKQIGYLIVLNYNGDPSKLSSTEASKEIKRLKSYVKATTAQKWYIEKLANDVNQDITFDLDILNVSEASTIISQLKKLKRVQQYGIKAI